MFVSFRDPAGRLFFHEGRVFRTINKTGERDFRSALSSEVIKEFMTSGRLVRTSELDPAEARSIASELSRVPEFGEIFKSDGGEPSLVVEHEKVPFQSFPYEWTPEMLRSAAALTLDLQEKLLTEGMRLKDATPYNILFRGTKPVFVDWLSFESREPTDSVWLAQAQFLRTFLLPLLVNKHFKLGLAPIFRVNRDGLEPESVYEMSSGIKKLLPPFLTLVTLPKLLTKKVGTDTSVYSKGKSDDPEKAAFILERQCNYLRRLLKKVSPVANASSNWTEYVGSKQHFTDEYLKHKEEFVSKAFEQYKPERVLDIGCNTGYFSRVAARSGSSVISIDQDPAVVGKVWELAERENLDILPLVVDISRPSPALGWQNSEHPSFLERVKGKIDAVIMLAVIHHLLVTERVPLADILTLAAQITRDVLIIEFVPPDDPMFKIIARGRDHLFEGLTTETFQEACLKNFDVLRRERLTNSNRWLYLLRKK